jgi:uncharacterized protein YcfL
MRKTTVLTVFTLLLVACSAFGSMKENKMSLMNAPTSDILETTKERKMLSSIDYIEDEEEVDLGFDLYFYLPLGFNAYEGMEFDLNDIHYIELEEEI